MNIWIIILRLFHIFGAIFWVGFSLFIILIMTPLVNALGAQGKQVMNTMLESTKFTLIIAVSGGLTVLSGILLYITDANGSTDWVKSGQGIVFGIGGLFGIIAVIISGAVIGRAAREMTKLDKAIQAGGGTPTAEQASQLQALNARVESANKIELVVMLIAVFCMAIGRYVAF